MVLSYPRLLYDSSLSFLFLVTTSVFVYNNHHIMALAFKPSHSNPEAQSSVKAFPAANTMKYNITSLHYKISSSVEKGRVYTIAIGQWMTLKIDTALCLK